MSNIESDCKGNILNLSQYVNDDSGKIKQKGVHNPGPHKVNKIKKARLIGDDYVNF